MDKSFISAQISKINSEKAKSLHQEMLSDFQKENFAKFYANPFSLRPSAVMICLFEKDNHQKTLMIERTKVGAHSGEISFPGGKCEDSDSDNIETAIRETKEEIGIKIPRENILGILSKVEIPVSKFIVSPVVSQIDNATNFSLSENEVKKVLVVDIEELASSRTEHSVTIGNKSYVVPCFYYNNNVIWGASAMMINELLWVLGRF